jgi:hypothetical protein
VLQMKLPQKTTYDDYVEWSLDGIIHRVSGPAIEWPNGDREWYRYGRLHRRVVAGPARDTAAMQEWYEYGRRHRRDGAAVIHADGACEWWYRNERETEDTGRHRVNLYFIAVLSEFELYLPVGGSGGTYFCKHPLQNLIRGYL